MFRCRTIVSEQEVQVVYDNSSNRHRVPDTSRRVIDIATGVLIGFRGYSEREAFDELAEAVRSTGVGIGALATALVSLVGGRPGPTPHRDEAMTVWGDLLAARVFSSLTAARVS
jgi:hypothetical protein